MVDEDIAVKITRFEEIIAWQKAKELTMCLYAVLKKNKDYSYRDQLQRSAVSIMNNIAEGFERQTNREMKQFMFIAKGSCGEVRSMLHLGKELNYFHQLEFDRLLKLSEEISRLLSGFIKSLKQ